MKDGDMVRRSYPAKVLLLGEYTLLLGSAAVSLPTNRFSVTWAHEPDQPTLPDPFIRHLRKHCPYIYVDALTEKLNEGWRIVGNIPHGKGLGSSGAICAAIYDIFGCSVASNELLRVQLASMEAFFHGESSGMDPLTSLSDCVLYRVGDHFTPILDAAWENVYLIDTGISRLTAPLVDIFRKMLQEPAFKSAAQEWVNLVNVACEACVIGESVDFSYLWQHISHWQWKYLQPMIPEVLHDVWHAGLQEGTYYLKLCGAGGGGFMLCHSLHGPPLMIDFDIFELK